MECIFIEMHKYIHIISAHIHMSFENNYILFTIMELWLGRRYSMWPACLLHTASIFHPALARHKIAYASSLGVFCDVPTPKRMNEGKRWTQISLTCARNFRLKIHIIYTEQKRTWAAHIYLLRVPRMQIQIQERSEKPTKSHNVAFGENVCAAWMWIEMWKALRSNWSLAHFIAYDAYYTSMALFHNVCVRSVHRIHIMLCDHAISFASVYENCGLVLNRRSLTPHTHRVRVKLIQFNENLMPWNVAGLCTRRYCWLSSSSFFASLRLQANNASQINATSLFTF